jgi:hypothetical protein
VKAGSLELVPEPLGRLQLRELEIRTNGGCLSATRTEKSGRRD